MRAFLKGTYLKLDKVLMLVCVKSPLLSAVYYLVFRRGFFRECQSVLSGRLAYYAALSSAEASTSALLRRNIHRIEKGLIMRPMRTSFGADYIVETVDEYLRIRHIQTFSEEERMWAHDVLQKYFSTVEAVGAIVKARDALEKVGFFEVSNNEEVALLKRCPYPRSKIMKSHIDHAGFHQLCLQRRSVRWFKDIPIDESKVHRAIDTASLSPSACNRQPFRFIFLKAENAHEVAGFAMGTRGFAENLPALVVLVGDLSAYPFERDRHLIYIDSSLAAMSFMLALETLGLSSCPINWPDIESRERKLAERLKLNRHERPVLLMGVGEGLEDGGIPFSQKHKHEYLMVSGKI